MKRESIAVLLNIAIELVEKENRKELFSFFYTNCRDLLNRAMDRDRLIDRGETPSRFIQKITAGYRPDLYPKLVDFLYELNERIKGFGRVSWQDEGECVLLIYEDLPQGGLT